MGAYGRPALPKRRGLWRSAGAHQLYLRAADRLWQPSRPVLEHRRARLVRRVAKRLETAARRLQARRRATDARQGPVADLGARRLTTPAQTKSAGPRPRADPPGRVPPS